MNKENRTDNFELEDNDLENVSGGKGSVRTQPIVHHKCGNKNCRRTYTAERNIINGLYTCPYCGCTEYTVQ